MVLSVQYRLANGLLCPNEFVNSLLIIVARLLVKTLGENVCHNSMASDYFVFVTWSIIGQLVVHAACAVIMPARFGAVYV